jgi:nucleotide-binding universal stress UspA family protein
MKILIATDGSKFSCRALEKACEFAKGWNDVSFQVVSVYEAMVPVAAEPFAISAGYYQQLDDMARKRAEEAAQESVEFIRARVPDASIEITTKVELGIPQQVIVEAAGRWGADLVVVGSHGYGFWGRLALGSVSDAVVHHSPCSVLVVRS